MTDWRTSDRSGAGQCRYPVDKARNSIQLNIKKKNEEAFSYQLSYKSAHKSGSLEMEG